MCSKASNYHNMMSKQTEKKALEAERERISQRMKTLVKQKQVRWTCVHFYENPLTRVCANIMIIGELLLAALCQDNGC